VSAFNGPGITTKRSAVILTELQPVPFSGTGFFVPQSVEPQRPETGEHEPARSETRQFHAMRYGTGSTPARLYPCLSEDRAILNKEKFVVWLIIMFP
jgi:hypothetical protein